MAEKIVKEFKGKYHYGLGRRKTATARVRLYDGKGGFIVNERKAETYFSPKSLVGDILKPLREVGIKDKFDISVRVSGSGISAQAGAVRLGIARALLKFDDGFRATLRKGGFLTRDPRAIERKKYGLKKARKKPQFAKR